MNNRDNDTLYQYNKSHRDRYYFKKKYIQPKDLDLIYISTNIYVTINFL